MTSVSLSIVVPCYNEEACLQELHARLSKAARSVVGDDHEIVLVNDGSRDGSWAMMLEMADRKYFRWQEVAAVPAPSRATRRGDGGV